MWIVAKIKKNNFNIFRSQLEKKLSDIEYYFPKIDIKSKEPKNLLINYIFCFHPLFKKKNFIDINKTAKGLEYFLNTKDSDQKDIENFIKFCKENEDHKGYITNTFFRRFTIDKGKFVTGPFSNYFFSLIKKEKKKISVVVGDKSITISDKSRILYQPV